MFELSHDGEKFVAEEVVRHETGPSAVMVSAAYSDSKRSYLLAGQENYCQQYNVQSVLVSDDTPIETIGDNDVRQRKTKPKVKTDNNRNSKKIKFAIKPADSVKTDFNGEEPLLRVIRISRSGNIMATGLLAVLAILLV